jgi:putative copper resistance protein D
VSAVVWDGLPVIAKAVTYAATFGAAGGVFFLSYCRSAVGDGDRLSLQRLIRNLAAIAVCAGGARIMLTAASMSGAPSGLIDTALMRMVWQAGEGRATIVRTAGLLLMLPSAFSQRPPSVWSLACAAGAAASFAWAGHVRALGSGWMMLLLSIHLLAAAFWLGALAPLLLITRHGDARRAAAAAKRFGALAPPVVGALALAGLGLLCVLLGSASKLWSSSYGRFLVLKLAVVACLLGLATFNKLRLTPRLAADDLGALRSLRRSIRAELVLGLCILIITAALTTLTGPPALD